MLDFIPSQYRDKLFLTADDMQEILDVGENKTYEFLHDAPFRVVRIGQKLRIPAVGFWKWYLGDDA